MADLEAPGSLLNLEGATSVRVSPLSTTSFNCWPHPHWRIHIGSTFSNLHNRPQLRARGFVGQTDSSELNSLLSKLADRLVHWRELAISKSS